MQSSNQWIELEKQQLLSIIQALDFSMIKYKICRASPNIAKTWSDAGGEDAIRQYKNFMYLLKKYHKTADKTEYKLVPSIEVDEIWHHHILDTRFYSETCNKIYGFYMHHFPYFGLRGPNDYLDLLNSFEMTQELYYKEFSEYMYEVDF